MSSIDPELSQKLITLRRDFHQYPELSNHEEKTAKRILKFLDELGVTYQSGIAGHGIIADLPAKAKGPIIALRTDMDALPLEEETGLPFASKQQGVMHACGHDGHMAMTLGAAMLLKKKGNLPLPVRLIFQPAEEKGSGAKAMIKEGALDNVAMIFGGHLDRHHPAGTLVVSEGIVNASTDAFSIQIKGQEGHGARPHESIDAVVVGSLMVMGIQTLVSREVDPAFPSVISVGEFRAGYAPNIIAGQATLQGTIRAQHANVRDHLKQGLKRIVQAVCELHEAKGEVSFHGGTPPLINTDEMAELARKAAVHVVGENRVVKLRTANMGGEDFSYYLEKARGCYVRFGAQLSGSESFPAHSSKFDFDENALSVGARYLSMVTEVATQALLEKEQL